MAKIELKIGDKTYNRKWVDDISSTSQISTDPAGINYGVIPSTGSAKLRDVDGEIRADIESGVLPVSNAQTKVVINGNQIQEHITSDSDYDVINRELNLQFSDRISLLDKVTYGGMPLRDYSMTAYEMLDDVIGSYGDYAKEKPINWIKYQNANSITTISGHNSILVNTSDDWEIIGTPLKVTPDKQYTISYSINVGKAYTTSQGDGIPIQILRSEPINTDCSSLAVASAFLSKTVSENIGTITFTPTTNIVYLVINFGWASANQTDLLVSINSIKVNGNSFSIAVDNSKCLDFISGIGMVESNLGNRLAAITIQYPYLPSASFRETIEKFCTLAQMALSLDEDGKIIFCDARPIVKDTEISSGKLVSVPNQYKISNLNKTLFLKNKFDGVDISKYDVVRNVIYDTTVYTENVSDSTELQNTDSSASGTTQNVIGLCSFENKKTVGTYNQETGTFAFGYQLLYSGISSKFCTKKFTFPKKSADNLKTVLNTDEKIGITVTYNKYSGILSFRYNGSRGGNPYASNLTYSYSASSEITSSFDKDNDNYTTLTTTCSTGSYSVSVSIENKTYINGNTSISVIDDGASYKVRVIFQTQLTQATATGIASDLTTSFPVSGTITNTVPLKATISIGGNIKEISFNDVDCSSKGIENATNAITIPTSELMQNLSDVEKIRDTILSDYAGGVATASIDLFCGLKDWENGEIIQPNDILTIEGEDGYWRVTGRTFKYNGSPTLSLDLQKQTAVWRYICGGISSGTISTGNFTAYGTKKGTIKLPSHDYMKYPSRFTVSVVFNENGRTYTQKHTSTNSVRAYTYNVLGVFFCNCYITANWSAGTISYTADEKYKKIAGVERKSYVESITITAIEQFY